MTDDELLSNINKLEDNNLKLLMKSAMTLQQELNEDPGNIPKQKALARINAQISSIKSKIEMRNIKTDQDKFIHGSRKAVMYLNELNRKIGGTKFKEDVKKGRLIRYDGDQYSVNELNKYAESLPVKNKPTQVVSETVERAKRKEEAEIRLKEAMAKSAEFKLDVQHGKYIPKEEMYLELATRAIAFKDAIKNGFEARAQEIIYAVSGERTRAAEFVEIASQIIDYAMGEFSKPLAFELELPVDILAENEEQRIDVNG